MQETHNAATHNSGLINQKNPGKRRVGDGTPGPGRPKGMGNKLTENIRQAIEIAARDCHPRGLAGWLVDRANGGIQDRQIFAGMVGRVVPLQVNQDVTGGIAISLNWLGSRNIGTVTAQPKAIDAQTVELIEHSPPTHWTTNAALEGQGVSGSEAMAVRQAADPPPPVDPGDGGVAETGSPPLPPALQKKDIA